MKGAPLPINEAERIRVLHEYRILDTDVDPLFDNITTLAAHLCDVPIALVTLVDRERQWFKSAFGINLRETPRAHSFSAHAILGDEVFEVTNAEEDLRFRHNPMVTGSPGIRFYAGAPLVTPAGFALGTVCVIDRKPRRLTRSQRLALNQLGQLTMAMLDARHSQSRLGTLGSILDQSADEVLILDGESLEILYANEMALRTLGYSLPEITLLHPERINPDYSNRRFLELVAPLRSGEKKQLTFETEHVRKHGTRYPVEVRLHYSRERSQPVYAAIVTDLSGRKQAETSLQRANDKLEKSVHALTRQKNELASLRELSEVLQSCVALDEAYGMIAKFIPQLLGKHDGGLFIINDARTVVEIARVWGDLGPDDHPFSVQECWALRRNKPHLGGQDATFQCRHVTSKGAHYLCFPLLAQGESIGILHLRAPGAQDDMLTAKREFIEILVEQVTLSLANIRLQETLRNQAIRDSLTGLFNRRYLEETMPREERRAQRAQTAIGFIAIDIDRFKNINDTQGHEGGDMVLREFGALIRAHTREGDIPCRYGGEEFVIVLPGASFETCRGRAEEIRAAMEELEIRVHGSVLQATISAGVAAFPQHGLRWQDVLETADKMLYEAKARGRNRVACVPDASGQMEIGLDPP
jgi:diguanylate cyclase (GGDEF)-like protein/PAS domain S-box-containing protein